MNTLFLVFQFVGPHVSENNRLPAMAAPPRTTVVHLPDQESAVSQDLVPTHFEPRVPYQLRVGAAIDDHDHRIFLSRREPDRFDQPAVEQSSVRGLEMMHFAGQDLVLIKL